VHGTNLGAACFTLTIPPPTHIVVQVACHRKPGACVHLCPSAALVATCSMDGTIATRYSSLAGTENTLELPVHDAWAGGAVAVAFDATGRHVASAGSDGSLFIHLTAGAKLWLWVSEWGSRVRVLLGLGLEPVVHVMLNAIF